MLNLMMRSLMLIPYDDNTHLLKMEASRQFVMTIPNARLIYICSDDDANLMVGMTMTG